MLRATLFLPCKRLQNVRICTPPHWTCLAYPVPLPHAAVALQAAVTARAPSVGVPSVVPVVLLRLQRARVLRCKEGLCLVQSSPP
eukprot:6463624-Amphidinium_carterae.1